MGDRELPRSPAQEAPSTFRDELYPDYKATREKLADDLQADFDLGLEHVKRMLAAYGIPVVAQDGFEADDVIGTLAKQGVASGMDVVIVSGDKDFHQLVRPGVRLLNPGRGGPASVEESWVSVENGSERLGVPPERTVDYLALVGDASDNVPGVPGIGEKTAIELIATYGDLDAILANAESIPKKRPREALLANRDKAILSRTLVTIRDDAPVDLDLAHARFHAPDVPRLRQLYVELEFSSLARALADADDAPPSGDAAPAAADAVSPAERHPLADVPLAYTTVSDAATLARCVARCREVGMIAFDTETVLEPGAPGPINAQRSILVSLSIATAPGEAWYLPFAHTVAGEAQGDLLSGDGELAPVRPAVENLPPIASEGCDALRALLADPAVRKVAQNAKYDLLVLRRAGIAVDGLDFDPMLASYVLDPGRRSHGLDALALEVFAHRMVPYEEVAGKGKAQVGFDRVPVATAAHYSCEDADYTLRLRLHFEPLVEASGMASLFRDVEMPLVRVLEEMEWTGIAVDVAYLASLKARFVAERQRVEKEIHEAAGEAFNVNSTPQLRRILFEKLELPVKKKTATGPSTDASVLQELADEGHALPSLLMEYRELFKLEGTYLDALPQLVDPRDGRIHTTYNQTVAQTGRLSSSDPNLQNIPIRRELGRAIRKGFVAPAGSLLFGADYSQIELRLLAHLSQDPAFVAAFNAGGDIHKQTGAVIFGVPLDQVTPEMRARAKTINFATIYGQGARA
nr:DNA polymerase I [Gemmatimonadaceae bacterium]